METTRSLVLRAVQSLLVGVTTVSLLSSANFAHADSGKAVRTRVKRVGRSIASTHVKPKRQVRRSVASLPSKESSNTVVRELPQWHDQSGTGFAVFLGAGGGVLNTFANDQIQESNKSGPSLSGRGSITFYNDRLALDLGVSWMQSRISGTQESTSGSGRTTSYRAADVVTRAAMIDFSPRYRITRGLELGPMAGVMLGAQANFGETETGTSSPIFLGARGGYTWDQKTFQIRASLLAATSLTIPERQALLTMGSLEIGIPLVRGKTLVKETETTRIRENFQVETIETEQTVVQKIIEPIEVTKELLVFSFDDQVVHFEFDRAELLPQSRQFLDRLGRYLAARGEEWESIRIDGHTDSRGTGEYNQRLSQARAAAVKRALASAGVPMERLESHGYGKDQPIDPEESDVARARNRRVEVSFAGVKNARELRDSINRIRFATLQPRTCASGTCK